MPTEICSLNRKNGTPFRKDNELFSTERMLAALNVDTGASPESVLQNVRTAVDGFVKNAEQFDDLTMLCMEYKGGEMLLKTYELDIMAENENLSEVQSFLGECLAKVDCPAKAQRQMELAAEEIFVNIANYAYAPEKGTRGGACGSIGRPCYRHADFH